MSFSLVDFFKNVEPIPDELKDAGVEPLLLNLEVGQEVNVRGYGYSLCITSISRGRVIAVKGSMHLNTSIESIVGYNYNRPLNKTDFRDPYKHLTDWR